MEILFKDNEVVYTLEDDSMRKHSIHFISDYYVKKAIHLDDVEIIAHLIINDTTVPIFYIHDDYVIAKFGHRYDIYVISYEIGDRIYYTEVNIKKLKDGNII